MDTPLAPPGWNKTMDDLFADLAAGRIKEVGFPESAWARDYERSLLPPGTRRPRKGDLYDPLAAIELSVMTRWAAPWTGGGSVLLRPGQMIRIDSETDLAMPILVYALAVDYKVVERLAVPWWTRWRPAYRGFYLAVKTAELATHFRWLKPEEGTARTEAGPH